MSEKQKLPKTPIGRVSFHSVFEPTAMEEGQEKKYGVTLLFGKKMSADQVALYKAMKAKAEALCQEKFGCGLDGKYKGKAIKSPFRNGSEKEHLDGYDDSIIFVRFSGRNRPGVKGPSMETITEKDGQLFYNGCFAHLTYTVYAYSKVNHGIAFGLVNIQKVANGEPFGAGVSDPDDDFEAVETQGVEEEEVAF